MGLSAGDMSNQVESGLASRVFASFSSGIALFKDKEKGEPLQTFDLCIRTCVGIQIAYVPAESCFVFPWLGIGQ